jgi:hypothetical protein
MTTETQSWVPFLLWLGSLICNDEPIFFSLWWSLEVYTYLPDNKNVRVSKTWNPEIWNKMNTYAACMRERKNPNEILILKPRSKTRLGVRGEQFYDES